MFFISSGRKQNYCAYSTNRLYSIGMITMRTFRGTPVTLLYLLSLGIIGIRLFWLPSDLHAQINTDELGKGQGQVEFQNYTGPVTRVDSRAQIRGIGYPLGTAVKAGATRSGAENRYFVIHVVSAPEGDKLDADIVGLGPNVGVDHIRNLRLIIQGYLEGAYNYPAQDAVLLAEYITIYNAVFRGNWAYFNNAYKQAVLQYLTPEKVGLATRFSEWPGRTLMVIPLGNSTPGSLSAIDTSSLSDPQVIDKMREDDGSGIDQRTAMADLKDREAEEAEEAARRQREAIAAEEARIAAERERLAREQAEQDAAAADAAAKQREQELAEQERALAAQREAAQNAEDFAAQKRAEAEADRRDIALEQGQGLATDDTQGDQGSGGGDQQGQNKIAGVQEQTSGGADQQGQDRTGGTQEQTGDGVGQQGQTGADKDQAGGFIVSEDGQNMGILGMAITGSTSPIGYIVKVHPSTGRELQRSTLDSVNVRTVVLAGNKIFALAGKGSDPIRLVEIDSDTLEVIKRGDNDIHSESLLWAKGDNFYAIISSGGSPYLARFDTALTLQAQSMVALHPYAALNFQGEMLIVTQRTNGQVLLLDPMDLTEGR
jgi:hypothetical protein